MYLIRESSRLRWIIGKLTTAKRMSMSRTVDKAHWDKVKDACVSAKEDLELFITTYLKNREDDNNDITVK